MCILLLYVTTTERQGHARCACRCYSNPGVTARPRSGSSCVRWKQRSTDHEELPVVSNPIVIPPPSSGSQYQKSKQARKATTTTEQSGGGGRGGKHCCNGYARLFPDFCPPSHYFATTSGGAGRRPNPGGFGSHPPNAFQWYLKVRFMTLHIIWVTVAYGLMQHVVNALVSLTNLATTTFIHALDVIEEMATKTYTKRISCAGSSGSST